MKINNIYCMKLFNIKKVINLNLLIYNKCQNYEKKAIDSSDKTVLHVSLIARYEHIVERLLEVFNDQLLTKQDRDGCTALSLVAQLNGSTKMAK